MADTPTSPNTELLDGRYRVLHRLGRGSMGQVDVAIDIHLSRRVAIKRVRSGEIMPGALDLREEASALAAVRSTSVVAVHAFGHDAERAPFFVMEHVDGESLETLIDRHTESKVLIPEGRAVQILTAIADGLDAVHREGLIHRDVKPGNIVVERRTGRAVLVDFGIAVRASASEAELAMRWGTPDYMAPEYSGGANPSPLQDVYALGCVAFELLTGRAPYRGTAALDTLARHVEQPTPLVSSLRREAAHLDAVVLRAMHKDPLERFPTASAFARALEAHRLLVPTAPAKPEPASELLREDEGALRVLVVDDDPEYVRLAARAAQLTFAGARIPLSVSRSNNLNAAWASAARRRPDLVLLDFELPDGTGVDFLTHLRDLPGGLRTRVLVSSGRASVSDQWQFRLLGADDFVQKPTDLATLVDRIGIIGRQQGWLPRV